MTTFCLDLSVLNHAMFCSMELESFWQTCGIMQLSDSDKCDSSTIGVNYRGR